jgi:DNA-binding CsgD family transcriptional regulator
MSRATIVILDRDSARAIGLKVLIEKYLNQEAVIASSTTSIGAHGTNARFLITTDVLAQYPEYFLPRRHRVIIVNGPSGDNALPAIDTNREPDELIEALSRLLPDDSRDQSREMTGSPLSRREIDVLKLVARGFINKEIAEKLSISFNTVLTHRRNITTKLGIRSVSGLGVYAVMNGYISDSELKR